MSIGGGWEWEESLLPIGVSTLQLASQDTGSCIVTCECCRWWAPTVEVLKINDQSGSTLSTTPKNVHTWRHLLRIIPRVGVVYIHHLTVRASHHIAEVIVLAQREQARKHLGKRVRAAFGDG